MLSAKNGMVSYRQIRLGHEVGVEDDEELALGDRQRVVDVAGLGAGVALAADVVRSELLGKGAYLVRFSVVQHVCPVPAVHGHRGRQGAPDDVRALAVRGDVDVDRDFTITQVEGQFRQIGTGRDLLVVGPVEARLCVVEPVAAGIVPAGQNRPQRQQHLEDDDRLGGQDHQIGNPIPPVVEVEQK